MTYANIFMKWIAVSLLSTIPNSTIIIIYASINDLSFQDSMSFASPFPFNVLTVLATTLCYWFVIRGKDGISRDPNNVVLAGLIWAITDRVATPLLVGLFVPYFVSAILTGSTGSPTDLIVAPLLFSLLVSFFVFAVCTKTIAGNTQDRHEPSKILSSSFNDTYGKFSKEKEEDKSYVKLDDKASDVWIKRILMAAFLLFVLYFISKHLDSIN